MLGLFPAEHVFHESRYSNANAAPSDRPTILYVTNKFCFPPTSGGAVRESKLLEPLLGLFDIHYVGFTQNFDTDRTHARKLVDCFGSITLLRRQEPDLPPDVMPLRVREHYSPFGEHVIFKLIELVRPGTIHVEGCFLMHYLPRGLPCPVVLTEENIEFELDAGRSAVRGAEPSGEKAEDVARRIELDAWRAADVCIFVTPEDERTARSVIPEMNTRCLENSVDGDLLKEVTTRCLSPTPSALYAANYSWAPSEDGAYFLIDEIWPLILDIVPEAHLVLAGAGMSEELKLRAAKAEQVTYVGPFEKFADVANGAHVFLCPLRFGGGSKIKVIDAVSHRLPIVGTKEAQRGLPVGIKELIFCGETPRAIALLTASLFDGHRAREKVASSALSAIHLLPTWQSTAGELATIWQNLTTRGR
ncbi:glycosyltransferase [Ensifer sp. LCM 4579]|uniref:glycosyltransferase n=1 Tax=Ensifer sp. LCM 4579 TaxID=1848292 RepID=UPI0008D9026B|nr:glycosyltransferase [Ensifer sp. LCM 4579]OHV79338.1 hypothetical protein LCM4579_23535 [Ensifer sp. LCM 4579]